MFQMETSRLQYFCTIAETGSLTKAAEILGVSHSGLSKSITVLQEETKLKLFRPQGRGLEITEEGKWFYQKALEILKIEADITRKVSSPQLSIRIGMSEILAVTCSGILASELKEPFTIFETDVGEIENKLRNQSIDFGFTFSPSPQLDIDYQEIGTIKFNAYASAEFLKNKTPEEILYTIPASPVDFNPQGYKARDGWSQSISRTIHFQVSGFGIALDLLRKGFSAVYMPDFVAELENQTRSEKNKIIAVPAHAQAQSKRKLFLAKLKAHEETKDIKKASKVLRRLCH